MSADWWLHGMPLADLHGSCGSFDWQRLSMCRTDGRASYPALIVLSCFLARGASKVNTNIK
jgi:hypothetical protein